MYYDKICCGENNVKDTRWVMAMKRLSNIVATAYYLEAKGIYKQARYNKYIN